MHLTAAGDLRHEFRARVRTGQREELLRRQQHEEDRRRDRQAETADETSEFVDAAMAIISASETEAFRLELDSYDTATVAALQHNDEALDEVRARMDELLAKAYVLPDGRRIFKTEDGQRVFDEHGVELDRGEIDPDVIEDARPRWETYQPELEAFRKLERERSEILAYQAKLDIARERLDAGDMTRKEYDALRGELTADMPDAVRAQIDGMDSKPEASVSAQAEPAAPAEELDITADMMPTPAAPKLTIPG